MTTDRTQAARHAALNDRPSAAPAERRDGSAFAALLDAHAPAPRREAPRERAGEPRDAGVKRDQPRDAGVKHDQPRDAGVKHDQPRDAAPDRAPRDAGHGEQPAAERAAVTGPAVAVATVLPIAPPPEASPPATAAPAQPVPAAPIFMLAPEAVAAAPVATPAAPALPAAPAAAAVPAAVTPQPTAPALPAQPAQPAAAVPADEAAVAAPAQGAAPAPAPAAPAAATPQAPAPEAELPAAPAAEAPAAPEPHAAAPARAAATPEPAPAAAPSVQASSAEPVGSAPASTPLSGPVAPERAVPLHRAPAAVSTLLQFAVERGISHAKMSLRPAELGGIEIRLQATAAGVAAQVVADSPEAAKLLAQAGDDLRRALEARDVTLISLEVSTTSDDRQQQRARGEWTDGDDAGLTTSHGRGDADGDAEPGGRDLITQTVIELPGGLLVDVLA